jgi:hypothetical protein
MNLSVFETFRFFLVTGFDCEIIRDCVVVPAEGNDVNLILIALGLRVGAVLTIGLLLLWQNVLKNNWEQFN